MKAFLSHSSEDKDLVSAVYTALEPQCVWLDRVEIEWGDEFLERIEEGIKSATDFVLFWSKSSAQSGWVRLELNMAFILALKAKAIRLKVVVLDHTELPLRLQPYQYLSVISSENPVDDIVSALRSALSQPITAVRHKFVNRNSELERIEELINNPEIKLIFLHGFQGIGKASLANEAFRRFFEGAHVTDLAVGIGTGSVELALQLHHKAYGTIFPESTEAEALASLEHSLRAIIDRGQFILLRDCQHWFDYEGQPEEPLTTVLRLSRSLRDTVRRPLFLTATRRPRIPVDFATHIATIHVPGLPDNHVSALIGLWYELSQGKSLDVRSAGKVAPEIHGHPVAAKLAANLVAQYGVEHLLSYPKELVALRRDLARTLIRDLSLTADTTKLMETLSIIRTPVPQSVLVEALSIDDEVFQDAVAQATTAGLAESGDTGHLTVHPLIDDYFWRSHLNRDDYKQKAQTVAARVHQHLRSLPTESEDFITLLPAVFRLYALAGMLEEAYEVRRDLRGEVANAAIIHYNRRNFDLAEMFIRQVLDDDSHNWKMRQYLARIYIRKQRWEAADKLIDGLLNDRPFDIVSRHLHGWRMLRAQDHEGALRIFSEVLSRRSDHVASLRDSAECLYRIGRPGEALEFLGRAKKIESNNPYILELEARIFEEQGNYSEALVAARMAVTRDPARWALRHRLARILNALGHRREAIPEAREAVRLDPAQFLPRSTLVSLLLDDGSLDEAALNLNELEPHVAEQRERNICQHLRAQLLYKKAEFEQAIVLVEGQIGRRANLAASYGLLAEIRLTQYSIAEDKSLALSKLYLQQAAMAIEKCKEQADHRHDIVLRLRERLDALEGRR